MAKRTLLDDAYITWLENPSMTIGTKLRNEIAARLRELTSGGAGKTTVSRLREDHVPKPKHGKARGKKDGGASKKAKE